MKCHHSLSIAASIAIAMSAFSASTSAQTPAAATSSTDTAVPNATVTVSDTKVGQFADAYVKIQTLKKEADAKQSTGTDPAAAQQEQAALQSKMAEAVQQSGLDIAEFNQIAQAMVSDTDLRAKVLAQVQQRTQPGG